MDLLSLPQLLGFLAAALLITLSPGPDNLMVLSLGLARGRRAGMAFGAGCALGCLNHTLLATLGVSALIAASPTAFSLLRWAGGLYLLYLGVQALRSRGSALQLEAPTERPARLLLKGLFVNAINPKVVLFFLAFLPQFIDATAGFPVWLQFLILGTLVNAMFTIADIVCVLAAGAITARLSRVSALQRNLQRAGGAILVGLGLQVAFQRT